MIPLPLSRLTLAATLLLAFSACEKKSPAPAATSAPAAAPSAPAAVVPPTTPASVQRVVGRWLRSDGDYALVIRGGDAAGILQAEYFNPNSIHVSRAGWIEAAGKLKIFVELNDVGYPGSTYGLFHDPATDRLSGQYTQPSQQQTYDIEFARAGPTR